LTTAFPSGDIVWGLPGAAVGAPTVEADDFSTTPVFDLLREATARAPGSIALAGQSSSLTYADMLRLAQNSAAAVAEMVPPGGSVACLLPRTPEAVAGLLGCLMSGRLCMMLNIFGPTERLADLLTDAAPDVLLLDQPLPFPHAVPTLTLQTALAEPDKAWRPDHRWDPDAPFVVHFTSGSTGRPKGIVHSARSMLFRACEATEISPIGPSDRVFGHAVPVEINGPSILLLALARGARVVLGNLAVEGAGGLLRLLEREAVTSIMGAVPIYRLLFKMDGARNAFRSLRAIRTGSASQQKAELAAWRALLPPDCVYGHAYASTEALVMAQWIVPRDDARPGDDARPADGGDEEATIAAGVVRPYHDYAILNEDGRPVEFGAIGELMLRSRYIALGEWQGGRLVPGRMTPAPGRPGWRIFRTGDLVRLQADGMLRVVGRADRQIKINGIRIEPAEIEAVLRAEPGITDAVVVVCAEATSVTLHGFVVSTAADHPGLIAALRKRMAAALSGVMRPSRLTVLDRLPALPSGKVDIVALSQWWSEAHRHGTARPGHLSRHGAEAGGPDKACHDGLRGRCHDGLRSSYATRSVGRYCRAVP
jgi:acyl-coenzyme A synthetase/AMP-(fatty) acid ligase